LGDNFERVLSNLRSRIALLLEYRGRVVVDERLAQLLKLIDEKGSILAAAKSLGTSYSRAWEWISKAERILGVELVMRRRGGISGGGAKLTEEGRKLLSYYFEKARECGLTFPREVSVMPKEKLPDIFFAGSHDPILENLFGYFAKQMGYKVEISWIGSSGGLLALMLGEADISGIHLLDPDSGEYNIPYLRKYWIHDRVIVIRGYQREVSLAYSPQITLEGIEDLISGKIKIVNRNPGSGTRILLDQILRDIAKKNKLSFRKLTEKIPGYFFEVKTHIEVAKAIAAGKADAGLVLTFIAKSFNLRCISLRWEWYDFVILLERLKKKSVRDFITFLKSDTAKSIIKACQGYKVSDELGNIVYAPSNAPYKIEQLIKTIQ